MLQCTFQQQSTNLLGSEGVGGEGNCTVLGCQSKICCLFACLFGFFACWLFCVSVILFICFLWWEGWGAPAAHYKQGKFRHSTSVSSKSRAYLKTGHMWAMGTESDLALCSFAFCRTGKIYNFLMGWEAAERIKREKKSSWNVAFFFFFFFWLPKPNTLFLVVPWYLRSFRHSSSCLLCCLVIVPDQRRQNSVYC